MSQSSTNILSHTIASLLQNINWKIKTFKQIRIAKNMFSNKTFLKLLNSAQTPSKSINICKRFQHFIEIFVSSNKTFSLHTFLAKL